MPNHSSKKKFLKLPGYTGGSMAFKEFIAKNIQYPKEALAAGIEGSVVVEYNINDNGEVVSPHVLKGLGYGCDEEAVRLVSMLSYEKARNRGVRVKVTTKTKITFTLPRVSINYSTPEKKSPEKKSGGSESYGYTINL
ncbi:MAG: energy transducer TonB [Bacteroidetes bacterium]|nr:energy transducer TonB [Bacteroidota bacterium]